MSYDDLKKALLADASPVKRLASPAVLTARIIFVGSSLLVATVLMMGARADLSELITSQSYLSEAVILVLLVIVTAVAAFRLGVPGVTNGGMEYAIALILLAIFSFQVFGHDEAWTHVYQHSASCALTVLAFSGMLLPVMFSMLTRSAPLSPVRTGLIASFHCALIGVLALHFICPGTSVPHVMLWHVAPAVAIPVLLIIVYRKVLRF